MHKFRYIEFKSDKDDYEDSSQATNNFARRKRIAIQAKMRMQHQNQQKSAPPPEADTHETDENNSAVTTTEGVRDGDNESTCKEAEADDQPSRPERILHKPAGWQSTMNE